MDFNTRKADLSEPIFSASTVDVEGSDATRGFVVELGGVADFLLALGTIPRRARLSRCCSRPLNGQSGNLLDELVQVYLYLIPTL